jgi:hypothetical protein
LHVSTTGFGLELMAIRNLPTGDRYVRITNFVMPNCSAFDGVPVADSSAETISDNMGYQLHWHVPIDDYSHWKYTVIFRYTGKMDSSFQADSTRTSVKTFARHRMPPIVTCKTVTKWTKSYAGMGRKYYDHDKFATESQGVIADRTQEHLGPDGSRRRRHAQTTAEGDRGCRGGEEKPLLWRERGDEPWNRCPNSRVWVGTLKGRRAFGVSAAWNS